MTDRAFRFRRHETDCDGGTQFYACSKGSFRGCCSIDPCNTGKCPDNLTNGPSTPSSSSRSSRSTQTRTTSTSRHTRSTSIPPITSSPSPTMTTSIRSSSFTTTTETELATSPAPEPINLNSDKTAFIGGLSAALIIGMILICGALIWFLRWRRKKAGKWEGTRAMILCRRKKKAVENSVIPSSQEPKRRESCGELDGSNYRVELFTPSQGSTSVASPKIYADSPSIGSSTTASPSTQSMGWSNEKIATQDNISPLRGFSPISAMRQGRTTSSVPDYPVSNTRHPALAELDSSTDAITPLPSPHPPPPSQQLPHVPSPYSRENVRLTVTTPEGVILRPNLNDSTSQHQECQELEAPSHVMSFMEYPDKSGYRGGPST